MLDLFEGHLTNKIESNIFISNIPNVGVKLAEFKTSISFGKQIKK